jgi:hypothetical protein
MAVTSTPRSERGRLANKCDPQLQFFLARAFDVDLSPAVEDCVSRVDHVVLPASATGHDDARVRTHASEDNLECVAALFFKGSASCRHALEMHPSMYPAVDAR